MFPIKTAIVGCASVLALGLPTASATADANQPGIGSGWKSVTSADGTFAWRDTSQIIFLPNGKFGVLGAFDFTAEVDTRLQSREYSTPHSGTHRINLGRGENCKNQSGIGPEQITIRLFAQDFPGDDLMGSRTVSCTEGGTLQVDNVRNDTFYFVLTTNYGGAQPKRKFSGNVTYP